MAGKARLPAEPAAAAGTAAPLAGRAERTAAEEREATERQGERAAREGTVVPAVTAALWAATVETEPTAA